MSKFKIKIFIFVFLFLMNIKQSEDPANHENQNTQGIGDAIEPTSFSKEDLVKQEKRDTETFDPDSALPVKESDAELFARKAKDYVARFGENNLQVEPVYNQLQLLTQNFPASEVIAYHMAEATNFIIANHLYHSNPSGFEQEKIEKAYTSQKKLIHRFSDNAHIVETCIDVVLDMIRYYTSTGQNVKVAEAYQELSKQFRRFPQSYDITSKGLYVLSGIIPRLHSWHQSKYAESIYEDLIELSKVIPESHASRLAEAICGIINYLIEYRFWVCHVEEVYQDLQRLFYRFPYNDKVYAYLTKARSSLDTEKQRVILGVDVSLEEAEKQCEKIYQQFRIRAEIIKTDKEFYSDEIYLKTVKEKKYFVSVESPEKTAQTTTVLIRQAKLRYELMHSNRVHKVSHNNQGLATRIDEIKKDYAVAHKGEEPSLNRIASILNEHGINSPSGKAKWYAKSVQRIIDSSGDSSRTK